MRKYTLSEEISMYEKVLNRNKKKEVDLEQITKPKINSDLESKKEKSLIKKDK